MGDVSVWTQGAFVVVHRARRAGTAFEPVGIWAVADSGLTPYYPPESAEYEERGFRALTGTLAPSPAAAAHHLVSTSPSWSLWEPCVLVDSLADVWADVDAAAAEQREHRAAVAAAALHAQGSDLLLVDEPSGPVGWGALRAVNAHSWWLASALVRRHPELGVYEMHPGGGQYDVLLVAPVSQIVGGGAGVGPEILLNRVGSIQVHVGPDTIFQASWQDSVFAPTPLATVIAIEHAVGLPAPEEAVSSTGSPWSGVGRVPEVPGEIGSGTRPLAYATLAAVLATQVNAAQIWDVRSLFEDGSGWSSANEERIPDFSTAQEEMAGLQRTGYAGEPLSHFWRITRGQESVAIVSDSGLWHRSTGKPIVLQDEFAAAGNRLAPMVVKLLRKWL